MSAVRRTARVVGRALAGFGTFLLVAYLGGNLLLELKPGLVRAHVARELTTRLGEAQDASGRRLAELDIELGASRQTQTRQVCQLAFSMGPLSIEHHEQCALRTISAWPVDRERAIAHVASRTGVDRRTGGRCPGGYVSGPGVVAEYGVVAAGQEDACRRLFAPADGVPGEQERLIAGDLPRLAPDRTWLVLIEERELGTYVLGCGPRWLTASCQSPFGDRVEWGESPGSGTSTG